MDAFLYHLARGFITLVQALPLLWVARTGRTIGGLIYWLDARHRQVAQRNLERCFGQERTPAAIRELARENFRRIGENFGCAIKTAVMPLEALEPHLEVSVPDSILRPEPDGAAPKLVGAIGHFGNFELYARLGHVLNGYQMATTYRGLKQPGFDRLLKSLREKSGCLFFERRSGNDALKAFMAQPKVALGLLADQHAGRNGLRLPFFGLDSSTSAAPAVLALRYDCRLVTAFCFRIGLARWRFEVGEEIPTHQDGKPRTAAAIMLDVNRSLEVAIRRDPANWFWVHNRWKPPSKRRPVRPAASRAMQAGDRSSP